MQEIAKTCYKKQSDRKDPDKKSRQLVFSNTHKDAEFVAENIERSSNMKIDVHRGGLAQSDRTFTETSLKEGDIDGISCTPTLELGIDIGTVDVSISSFKTEYDTFTQRSGRAGREGKKSYAFCVFNPNDASCHYYSSIFLE
jgi:DEAD/DEAH box helicase domain-containing protein